MRPLGSFHRYLRSVVALCMVFTFSLMVVSWVTSNKTFFYLNQEEYQDQNASSDNRISSHSTKVATDSSNFLKTSNVTLSKPYSNTTGSTTTLSKAKDTKMSTTTSRTTSVSSTSTTKPTPNSTTPAPALPLCNRIVADEKSSFYTDNMIKLKNLPLPFIQELPSMIYSSLLDVNPPKFLPNFKNPCWVEELPDIGHIYNKDETWNLHMNLGDVRQKMEKWYSHRLEINKPWRIRCLPYFYIGGVQKCGTSELFFKLGRHPNITLSHFKEPHFWTRFRNGWTADGFVPIRNYIDLFDRTSEYIKKVVVSSDPDPGPEAYHPVIFGDGSVTTMCEDDWWFKVPENAGQSEPQYSVADYIKHITPDAKFIFTLRNPTDRLYSDYIHLYHREEEKSPDRFHELAIQSVGIMKGCLIKRTPFQCVMDHELYRMTELNLRYGIYVVYLEEWMQVFPRAQIHVVRLETMNKNRTKTLNNICKFLGVGEFPADISQEMESLRPANVHNSTRPMLLETRLLLNDFYKPFTKKLASLLHDDRFLWKSYQI